MYLFPKRQHYSVTSNFVLTPDKLSRIVDVGVNNYAEIGKECSIRFSVTLKNDRQFVTDDIREILAMDNTVSNPISVLTIYFAEKNDELASLYGSDGVCSVELEDHEYRNVSVSVISSDAKWAKTSCDNLSEQVNRILVDWPLKMPKWVTGFGLIISTLLVTLGGLLIALSSMNIRSYPYLSEESFREISVMPEARNADEQLSYIYKLNRASIAQARKDSENEYLKRIGNYALNNKGRFVFLAFPVFSIIGLIVYVLIKCYPRVVFFWGDYKEYFEILVAKRKFIWGAVVLSSLVGIIGNLFVNSLNI